MNSTVPVKTFDAVRMVRTLRDGVSSKIAAMTVEEENRWLRESELSDSGLRRLMELASRRDQSTNSPSRHS